MNCARFGMGVLKKGQPENILLVARFKEATKRLQDTPDAVFAGGLPRTEA